MNDWNYYRRKGQCGSVTVCGGGVVVSAGGGCRRSVKVISEFGGGGPTISGVHKVVGVSDGGMGTGTAVEGGLSSSASD